jgi:adenylosuccinate lyase
MTAPTDRRRDVYVNPLGTRYASPAMLHVFSDERRFGTWRRLWLALARAQRELGLDISAEQIAEMEAHLDDIDYAVAEERERLVRHDVMAHVHAFGVQCPAAAPIIHLGATSMFVVDNTDLVLLRDAYGIVRGRLVRAIAALRDLAVAHRDVPCLAYTHFQPAQPTTFGRRACLWLQDLLLDLETCEWQRGRLRMRGAKGTTGTQASFLTLFDGDHEKVGELDRRVAAAMGFEGTFPVTGQTVSRKVFADALTFLAGVAQSAQKVANDVRLLMGIGCVEEPIGKSQIGSSAMAYKRNPMRSERMTSLARLVMSLASYAEITAAEQWLERTLDDSAGNRIAIPEAFLATDALLVLLENVTGGLQVYPAALHRELARELPFMATEEILMRAVAAGGDRQELHENIRTHAHAAARRIKEEGAENDMLERLAADPAFAAVKDEMRGMLEPSRFVGRSPEQVDAFVAEHVEPVLEQHRDALETEAGEVRV